MGPKGTKDPYDMGVCSAMTFGCSLRTLISELSYYPHAQDAWGNLALLLVWDATVPTSCSNETSF